MRRYIDKIGNKLKHERFHDQAFAHVRRPRKQATEQHEPHEVRVVRYDEWGKKINETQNA
jgi:hypothetical protein